MTVRELIDELKEMPEEAEARIVFDGGAADDGISRVSDDSVVSRYPPLESGPCGRSIVQIIGAGEL